MQYCLHIPDIRKMAETTTVNIRYLIQQTTQSIINNHLSFMMSLLYVLAFTRPSSGRLQIVSKMCMCWEWIQYYHLQLLKMF